MIESIGTELPKEIARVREILGYYKEIGSAGAFGAAMIEQDLSEADNAIISGDVVAMLRVYKKLQETQS